MIDKLDRNAGLGGMGPVEAEAEEIPLTLGLIAEAFKTAGEEMPEKVDVLTDQMEVMNADVARKLTPSWNIITAMFARMAKVANGKLSKAWQQITTAFSRMASMGLAVVSRVQSLLKQLAALAVSMKKSGGGKNRVKRMADGGMIDEPIYGLGLTSGQNYLMGEAGPEMVTPVGKKSQNMVTHPITVNMNITNRPDADNILQRIKQENSLTEKRLGVI